MAAFDTLDPEELTYPLDIVSVMESVLESPRQILFAQQHAARGEAIAEMKADGLEYDERMALLDQITWPQPLLEHLEATYEIYRQSHPWLFEDALNPKSIVREMYEQGMSFTDFVGRYGLARSEGLVLRYLTDAYRALRQSVPDAHRPPELDDLIEWLGETVRQTDSSLLDEWEALNDPAHVARTVAEGAPPPAPRAISLQERPFHVMIRNAMWRRVELVARDDLDGLMTMERADADRTDPPLEVTMTRSAWDQAIEDYYAEHDSVGMDADARGPDLLAIEKGTPPVAGAPDHRRPRRPPRLGDRGRDRPRRLRRSGRAGHPDDRDAAALNCRKAVSRLVAGAPRTSTTVCPTHPRASEKRVPRRDTPARRKRSSPRTHPQLLHRLLHRQGKPVYSGGTSCTVPHRSGQVPVGVADWVVGPAEET